MPGDWRISILFLFSQIGKNRTVQQATGLVSERYSTWKDLRADAKEINL